jgi:hypothetical protein
VRRRRIDTQTWRVKQDASEDGLEGEGVGVTWGSHRNSASAFSFRMNLRSGMATSNSVPNGRACGRSRLMRVPSRARAASSASRPRQLTYMTRGTTTCETDRYGLDKDI